MKRKVDPDKLRELTAKGYSGRQIAEVFGVHPTAIYHWRRRLGLSRKKGRGKVDPEKLRELLEKGYGGRRIARALGVHHTLVYYYMRKLGLKRKKKGKVDVEKFKELYRKGLTYREMAEILGCHPMTLVLLREKLGLPSRRRGMALRGERIREDIVEYVRRRGFCLKEEVVKYIAEKYGVKGYRVNSYILQLWRSGRIGKVRMGSNWRCGSSKILKRALRYSGLQRKTILYTDEGRLAEFLAAKLVSQLRRLPTPTTYARIGLKLGLKNALPRHLYEKVAVLI